MNNQRKKVLTTIIMLAIWGLVMMYASGQSYSEQDLRPQFSRFDLTWVEEWFGWVQFTYSSSVISVESRGPAAFLEFFVRKGAHIAVFFTLGFLVARLLSLLSMHGSIQYILAVVLVISVASIDEYRHFLHPERTGLLADVILDSIAGLVGISLYTIYYIAKQWRR